MNKRWYKTAVIYSLDLETFRDANHDGVGDIKGLNRSLHYLSALGIDCIWLLPFYDSPNRDNGYDVRDYFEIDRRLGDPGYFAALLESAEEAGIRVIIDLVANHTSDQHEWFQQARRDEGSRYRDYYIWAEEKPERDGVHAVFGEQQGFTNWTYDSEAGAYYYHTFYPHQPDLNLTNPEVQDEIIRIMHFWLKLGVSGFRMDAARHMVREKGSLKFAGDPHHIFRRFRECIESRSPDAVLLAEVDVEPDQYADYFGSRDQIHMLFNFYINNYIFLAFARGKAEPLIRALHRFPACHPEGQMANFLRNHDQLDLDRLSEAERAEVLQAFAPDEDMRIFGQGIRRRLAPMLGQDRKRMEMAYSLLMSLPGTPVLNYGQETGMGDDLSASGRGSVRSPMQWNGQANGGFSDADQEKLVRNMISGGPFSYKHINVQDQYRDPGSFLSWMIRLIHIRKETPEIGYGACKVLPQTDPRVLVLHYTHQDNLIVILHNFSDQEVKISLGPGIGDALSVVFSNGSYAAFHPDAPEVQLSAYGYRWMRKPIVY